MYNVIQVKLYRNTEIGRCRIMTAEKSRCVDFKKKSVTNFDLARITLQKWLYALHTADGAGLYTARQFCGILRRYSSYDNNKA